MFKRLWSELSGICIPLSYLAIGLTLIIIGCLYAIGYQIMACF